MVSNHSTNYKQDGYRCLFNKQIILMSEKTSVILVLVCVSFMSFRFFKVTDKIGFTFAPHCNWFLKTSKLLREFYLFKVG